MMIRKRFLGDDLYMTPDAIWHSYVISCYYGIAYNINTMMDDEMMQIIRRYLSSVYDNEFDKLPVLNIIRECKRKVILRNAKIEFKSIFVKKRPKHPMMRPSTDELPGNAFNLEAIKQLGLDKINLEEVRRQIVMNNIQISGDSESNDIVIDVARLVPTGETTSSGRPRLKEEVVQVNANELTIDNFSELTGRRFRMTSEQRERFGQDREAAFQDWLNHKVEEVRSNV